MCKCRIINIKCHKAGVFIKVPTAMLYQKTTLKHFYSEELGIYVCRCSVDNAITTC